MEIRKAQQNLEIKKVEEDKRSEVSKIKPGFQQQTPDSFELGRSRDENTNSQTTKSNPTIDQAANAILIKQMTTARLTPARLNNNEQPKETKGERELGTDEQNAANSTGHEVPDQNAGMDTGTSYGPRVPAGAFAGDARSRIGEADQALRDIVAKSGTGMTSNTSGGPPPGGPSSRFGTGSIGEAFAGGPTGPSNPMDNVNEKYEQALKLANLNSPGNPSQALQDAIRSADQSAFQGYGKEMVATGSLGIDPTPAEIEAAKKGASQNKTEEKKEPSTWEKVKEAVTDWWADNKEDIKDTATDATLDAAEEVVKYMPGVADALGAPKTVGEVTGDSTDLLRGAELIGKMKEGNYEGMGSGTTPNSKKKPGASSTTQDEYNRQEMEKHKEEVRNALGDIGIDPFSLPRRPVIQGDIDPPQDQQNGKGEYQPGLLQQFGKDGLIGNPGSADANGPSGGSANFGQRGSNIDYENGSGYMGANRTKDPQDVDVSGGGLDRLVVASRDEKKEEEEEENRISTQKKRT